MISHEGTKARRHEVGDEEEFSLPRLPVSPSPTDGLYKSPTSQKNRSFRLSFLRAFVPSCLRVRNHFASFRLSVRHLLLPLMAVLAISGSAQTDDHIFVSPKTTYKIFQEAIKDGDSRFWTTKLRFAKGKQECVTISDSVCWPGNFYISPDEKWVLQIQKTGSGDNNGFLYLIEPNHRVWRMAETLCPLALEFLGRVAKFSESDLYHTGIEFDAWDTKAGLLRFTLHGAKVSGGGIQRKLVYKLKDNTIVEP